MRFLPAIASLLLLASCTKYNNLYEVQPASKSIPLAKGCQYEDDNVRIDYVFWAPDGSMGFSVYNKLDIPIYIDWKKSSLVRNSQKSNYWVDEINTKSKSKTKSSSFSSLYYGAYNFASFSSGITLSTSQSVKPERVTFLAPKSSITRIQENLLSINKRVSSEAPKGTVENPYNKTIISGKYEEFNSQSTPFTFRNFITIATTEAFNKEIYVDNEFYLSKVYKLKRTYFEPVYVLNPATKKKEKTNLLAQAKRFYTQL